MTAETTTAPRPARWRARRTLALSVLGCGALAAVAACGPSVLAASPAAAAPADGIITLTVLADSPVLLPGQDLHATVVVTNTGAEAVEAGSVAFTADTDVLDRTGIEGWLAPTASGDGDGDASGPTANVEVPRLLPSASTSVPVTIPAAALALETAAFGPRGLEAAYSAGGELLATDHGVLTWQTGQLPAPVSLAMATPMTVPQGTTGLLGADDLEALTRPGGILTRQLDGVTGHPIAVAIDPMVIASIRALGTAAPASATLWLERLAELSNETFALAWSDADVAAQAQAGVPTLLAPTSLDYALDPAAFPGEPTPAPTTPAATDEPTQAPAAVPSLEELTAWPYSLTGVAWPAPGGTRAADLGAFAANGLTTAIVSSSDLAERGSATPRMAGQSGESRIGLADSALSTAISRAADATSQNEWGDAMDAAAAYLAAAASEPGGGAVLAALDRGWPATAGRFGDTLTTLGQLPWTSSTSLAAGLAEPAVGTTLDEVGESADRIASVTGLIADEARIDQFASALVVPSDLTGRERNALLALLAVNWRTDSEGWSTAVSDHRAQSVQTLTAVSIVHSGPVLVIGSPASIPISVRNELPYPVNVRVQATPSNGRLIVENGVDATVEAGSSSKVLIPVTAQVGSGEVVLRLRMTSPTGVDIGAPTALTVTVQADWEGIGALVIGGLAVALFTVGLIRNVRRRRRERARAEAEGRGEGDSPVDEAADQPTEDAADEPVDREADTDDDADGSAPTDEGIPRG